MPEPEPPLKIMPSSTYQFRIAGMVSSTPRIKQALACWARSGAPMLNQTGLLKAARWVASTYFSSSRKSSASVSVAKVAFLHALAGDSVDDAVNQVLK